MEYKFEVQEPEEGIKAVPGPQMLVEQTQSDEIKVTLYFMANKALEISNGIASSSMGKVKLQYIASIPSEAYTTSISLRKIVFTFANPQGMARNFEFYGQKT